MNTLFVIDVMPLLYRGHFAFLRTPRMTTDGINTSSLFSFTNVILQIIAEYNPSHIALVFDSTTPTFRHDFFPEYKAGRDKLPEDIAISIGYAWDFAKAMRIPALRVDGFEADDLMGSLAELASSQGFKTYLVSPDKDIAQLVREGVNLLRLNGKNTEIWTEKEVCDHWGLKTPNQMIDYLALAGDASDNIPGVRGIGEKSAQRLLSSYNNIEEIIEAAQKGQICGKSGERLISEAEKARISRYLTTIRTDVPLSVALDDLKVCEPNREDAAAFANRFELTSLLKKLGLKDKESNRLPLSEDLFNAQNSTDAIQYSHKKITVNIISSADELASLIQKLKSAKIFSFDTEATSQDPTTAQLVGISFSTQNGEGWYLPCPKEDKGELTQADLFALDPIFAPTPKPTSHDGLSFSEIKAALTPVFLSTSIEKVGHNIKYDLTLLSRYGLEINGPCHDTMLMHYAIDSSERHNLDRLAKIYLCQEMIPISSLIGEGQKADPQILATLKPEEIADYAAEDAEATLNLYHILKEKTDEYGITSGLSESEEPLVKVLLEMENAGVKIDTEKLRTFGEELSKEIAILEVSIFTQAGEAFNLNSPRQLGQILFEKLAIDPKAHKTASKGQYITSEEVLLKYASKHKIISDVLEYRAIQKLKSTYVDKLPSFINPETKRVHTHFSQAFTETGRLASSDPNLQNIPIRTERGKRIREAIIPRDENHILISADYSQIELRIMAALSKDENMVDAFKSGQDIHAQTASKVFGIPIEEVTPSQRSSCKMVNFGIIYGISVFGLSQRLGIAHGEAANLITEYFKQYPGIRAYMDKAVEDARKNGYASTILNRRRVLRDINSRNSVIRSQAERNAINTPVQGSAADLIKIAMVKVHDALFKRGLKAKLILQIHDELLFDVPKEEADEVSAIVKEAMVRAYDFGVPLEVEIGRGENWLLAH